MRGLQNCYVKVGMLQPALANKIKWLLRILLLPEVRMHTTDAGAMFVALNVLRG
jgi:hypothetical protein